MTKTITKADIVDYLNNELGLNKSECKILIEDFFDEIKNSSPLEDISMSAIEEEYKAILKFSYKVNEDLSSISESDVDEILSNGFSDNVISEVIAICSAAQYMNTTVKAHNIPPLNENMNSASVRMMIQKGYQGLADYMLEKRKR